VDDLIRDVTKAKEGDLEACGRLVQNTQAMVYGVAFADCATPRWLRMRRRNRIFARSAIFAS
jgi:hypothetical protein